MRFKAFHRALSGLMAAALLTLAPACDYGDAAAWAAVVATGSDAEMAGDGARGMADPEGRQESEGEYMPDNILSRYEESFNYCPETVPSPYARIALADDVVVVIVALLAMCGIYVGSNSDLVHQIASGFDTYIRRTAGNVKSVMEAWAAVLSAEAGKAIAGIKVLLPYLRDYLKSFFTGYGTGALEYSYSTGAGVLKDGPYAAPVLPANIDRYTYLFSFQRPKNPSYIDDVFLNPLDKNGLATVVAAYMNSNSIIFAGFNDVDVFASQSAKYHSYRIAVGDGNFKYSDGLVYEFSQNPASWTGLDADGNAQFFANCVPFPVFKDLDYARSYVKYGVLDGLIQPDPDFTVTVLNAWTQLQQDALDRFGNTLTLPSTPEEWAAIQNQLASAATADDALNALSKVIDINSSGGITSMTPYLHLSYVLDAVSVYAGAGTLSADVRNGFLKDYLNITIDGATIEQLNTWAQTVVNSQVVITGKDEDNDKNSFIITAALVAALLEYLYAKNLLEAIPDIAAGTQVRANVRVADKAVNPPDGGGSADLSGILSIISSILAAIGGLPALIATEAIKALASSAFANGITLNLDSIRTGIGQIAQWDFADWASALGASVLLALKTAAEDFGLDGLSNAVDRIADWDFADWGLVLSGALEGALKAAGLDKVKDALASIAQWDFSDWGSVFRSVIDTALASSGLASLAGLLADIKEGLSSLGITVDLSGLLASLADIKDTILSIPASIVSFFTIDMTAISSAYDALTVAFQGRFSGISQLGKVFSYSFRDFDSTPPVFYMQTPDCLRFAIKEDRFVVLDLTSQAEVFRWIRVILEASIWMLFAKWVLDQFDVKFHIG